MLLQLSTSEIEKRAEWLPGKLWPMTSPAGWMGLVGDLAGMAGGQNDVTFQGVALYVWKLGIGLDAYN